MNEQPTKKTTVNKINKKMREKKQLPEQTQSFKHTQL